jgi:phosphonate transport system substrate-binding protein
MSKSGFGLMLLSIATVVLLVVAACGPAEAPADTPQPTVAVETSPTAEVMASPTPDEGVGAGTNLGTDASPIIMSFVPSGDTQEIIASGDEIAAAISEATGLTIRANVGTDFAAVREAMCAGQAHIGWLNTFNYVLANEVCGVDVGLVTERFGLTTYQGQIIVNADSGIETLQDLEGKVMCWVDPNSTSGYIIPRITLAANGIDPDAAFSRTLEAGSHNNVVIQVYNGECDAGATYVDARSAVETEFPDVNERVVILATTTDIPNDSVSFSPDFPAEMRQQIVDALLAFSETEEGVEALENLYSISGLQEADDSFYDEFRADLSRAGIDIEELAR